MSTDNTGQPPPPLAATETLPPMREPIAAATKRSRLGRAWQRFWRSDLRRLAQPLDTERADLLRRARLAVEIARRVSASPEPLDGSPVPILCDLYRQSIHWSLRALVNAPSDPSAAAEARPTELWQGVDSSLLIKAAGGEEALRQLEPAVQELNFQDFAALSPDARARLLISLRGVATALVAELEMPERIVSALWMQRLLRSSALVVLIVLVGVALAVLKNKAEARRDIANGKAWRTSSFYGGCHSPDQDCADSPDYFFHTNDEANPWVEFDLGAKSRFSAVRVDNRMDCCAERASPLVVEVSDDQRQWRVVARHEGTFATWLAEFAPAEARWLRLRVDAKQSLFHLAHVRILR